VSTGMPNRWVIAIAGTVVMLTIGCLYSWGLFTQPLLVAYEWDLRTTTWAYAIANFSLAAVGAVIGGFSQDRAGPRKVAMVGVALWGAGNVLAGLATSSLGAPWLYTTYGIMGGMGAGMAYITPVAMVRCRSFICCGCSYLSMSSAALPSSQMRCSSSRI
jgi:OFA family oxalate/formate antiporter-like MFS transporter